MNDFDGTVYVQRPLAKYVQNCPRKVAILEGARAVGKTLLAKRQLSSFHYVSLAEDSTYRYASTHLEEWLSSLSLPCVIDEAQRIPDLPLAVKGIVDDSSGRTPLFVLTGSASITREGLDGQDPLTRRSLRYTLSPMTQRELLRNTQKSIVDLLWEGTPDVDYVSQLSRADLSRMMQIGGFPSYALNGAAMTDNQIRQSVQADLDSVLGDTILPDERFDRAIGEAVLKELLTVPGGILNVKRISDTIRSTAVTVERYISILMRRFLLIALPNLRTAPSRQTFTRAKIHPIDTSISAEMLKRSGKDFRDDPVIFGELFESFVVNQIVPEIQWSERRPDAFYWREPGRTPKEVDLVLVHDDEVVAIEVKSNQKVKREDFADIAALAEHKNLKRGYVIYTGDKILKFGERMFALPVSALWDEKGFIEDETEGNSGNALQFSNAYQQSLVLESQSNAKEVQEEEEMQMPAANIFLSYRHADNDHLNGGIVQLLKDIQSEFEYKNAKTVRLFIDSESLNWGDDWQNALDQAVGMSNIIIPAVTPRYLQSAACRKELLDFYNHIGNDPNKKILPLIIQNIDGVSGLSQDDPVWKIVHASQHLVVRDLRLLSPTEREKEVIRITDRLTRVIKTMDETTASAQQDTQKNDDKSDGGEEGILDQILKMKQSGTDLNIALEKYGQGLNTVAEIVNRHPIPESRTMEEHSRWAQELSEELKPALKTVDDASAQISNNWEVIYAALQVWVTGIKEISSSAERNDQIDLIAQMLQGWHNSFQMSESIRVLPAQFTLISAFYPSLRPLARTLKSSIEMIGNMDKMTVSLQHRVESLR